MLKSKRTAIIAGNWKMNKTPAEAKDLIEKLIPKTTCGDCEVVICPPFVDLALALELTKGTNIKVGAQNCHFEEKGAFTGEISPLMLKEMGIEYVIIGHSERRQYFGETNETVNKRTLAALNHGLKPIVCVGETLNEREQGITKDLIAIQTKIALLGVSAEQMKDVVIAYEPVWAIGTGKTATSEQAQEVCESIRKTIADIFCDEVAQGVTIQYGGSMNPSNAQELLSKVDIDGGLIGGAALKEDDFAAIIAATK